MNWTEYLLVCWWNQTKELWSGSCYSHLSVFCGQLTCTEGSNKGSMTFCIFLKMSKAWDSLCWLTHTLSCCPHHTILYWEKMFKEITEHVFEKNYRKIHKLYTLIIWSKTSSTFISCSLKWIWTFEGISAVSLQTSARLLLLLCWRTDRGKACSGADVP